MLLIISAMLEEQAEYIKLFSDVQEVKTVPFNVKKAKFNSLNCTLLISGIGKAQAASSLTFAMEQFKPKMLIVVGTCGGLKDAQIGDIVVSKEAGYGDVDVRAFNYKLGQLPNQKEFFESNLTNFDDLIKQIQESHIKTGLIVTLDSFVADKEKAKNVANMYKNSIAIEMETASFAQIANLYGIPFLLIKKVSDLADQEASSSFNKNINSIEQNLLATVQKVLEYYENLLRQA